VNRPPNTSSTPRFRSTFVVSQPVLARSRRHPAEVGRPRYHRIGPGQAELGRRQQQHRPTNWSAAETSAAAMVIRPASRIGMLGSAPPGPSPARRFLGLAVSTMSSDRGRWGGRARPRTRRAGRGRAAAGRSPGGCGSRCGRRPAARWPPGRSRALTVGCPRRAWWWRRGRCARSRSKRCRQVSSSARWQPAD
jgi:hypothetical protein